MAPKRGGTGTQTSKKRAKPASATTPIGIPELFKKVKSDLGPEPAKAKPEADAPVVEEIEPPAPPSAAKEEPSSSSEAAAAAPPAPLTDEEDSLLRAFDLETAYGPSLGLSRKERWLRAEGARPAAANPLSSSRACVC